MIVDGSLGSDLQAALSAALDAAMARYPWEGATRPLLLPGALLP